MVNYKKKATTRRLSNFPLDECSLCRLRASSTADNRQHRPVNNLVLPVNDCK